MSRRKWSDYLFSFFALVVAVTFASCAPDTTVDTGRYEEYATKDGPDAATAEAEPDEIDPDEIDPDEIDPDEPKRWSEAERRQRAAQQAESRQRAAQQAESRQRAAQQAEIERRRQARTEQEAVTGFINGLSSGDFFHTVPKELGVNTETIIQAGIAEKVSQELLDKLSATPEQEIIIKRSVARYDPTGTEIVFWADEEAFDIDPIESGKKTIISGDEQLWSWRIKPLKAGEYFIILKAVVEVRIQGSEKEYPSREFVLFREKRRVRGNLVYSFRQFAANNPGIAISSVIGSGSLGGLVGSFIARRQAELKAEAESKRTVGFAHTKATHKNG